MSSKFNVSSIVIILIIQFTTNTYSKNIQDGFWRFKEKTNEGSYYQLNFLAEMKESLQFAPHVNEKKESEVILKMPTSFGEKLSFKFYENDVVHPNLRKKYSKIKTYVGVGIENPTHRSTIVLNGDRIVGSVDSERDPSHFKSFSAADQNNGVLVFSEKFPNQNTICKTRNSISEQNREFPECMGSDEPCYPSGKELVTYRFAAMVTEDVNNEAADGTVEGGLTWLVGSVAYVNAMYVRDVTFQLQIVENNDELIFTNNNPAPEVFKVIVEVVGTI